LGKAKLSKPVSNTSQLKAVGCLVAVVLTHVASHFQIFLECPEPTFLKMQMPGADRALAGLCHRPTTPLEAAHLIRKHDVFVLRVRTLNFWLPLVFRRTSLMLRVQHQ
jgi:hypothetical protein